MHRRRFLLNGATLFSILAAFGDEAAASSSSRPRLARLGGTEPFDYARLKGRARAMAAAPYQANVRELPKRVASLDWDKWQSIAFRKDHSLWADEGLPFVARFFHLGFMMTKPVRIYTVESGKSQQLAYDPA